MSTIISLEKNLYQVRYLCQCLAFFVHWNQVTWPLSSNLVIEIQFFTQNLKFQNLPIVRASTFYFFFFCHQQLQVILYAAWAWMMEYLVEPLHKVSPWFWQYPTLFSLNELHIEFKVFARQLLHIYYLNI